MFFRPRHISEVIVSCGVKFFITLRSVLLSFLFSYLPIQLFNWKSDKYRICITAALDLAKFWCRIIILQVAVIVKNPVMTCTMKCGCLPISIVKLGCNVRRRSIITWRIFIKDMFQLFDYLLQPKFGCDIHYFRSFKISRVTAKPSFDFALKPPFVATKKGLFS